MVSDEKQCPNSPTLSSMTWCLPPLSEYSAPNGEAKPIPCHDLWYPWKLTMYEDQVENM